MLELRGKKSKKKKKQQKTKQNKTKNNTNKQTNKTKKIHATNVKLFVIKKTKQKTIEYIEIKSFLIEEFYRWWN